MKEKIRQTHLKERAELSLESINNMSLAVAKNVRKSNIFQKSQRIGFYYSVRGEADPSSLKTDNKHFFLPVLSKNLNQGLVFIELNNDTKLEINKFKIPEPAYDKTKIVGANTLDLVLVPLLGFDKDGNRLGMGGGFYDRCFAFKKKQNTKPILMGFAYDFQKVDSLKTESWGIGLDAIATETSIIYPEQTKQTL